VRIQLERVIHLLADRDYHLEVTPEAMEYLAETGYDPNYGARPLKRTIQQKLVNPLAKEILAGKFLDGDAVRIDATPHAFTFQKDTGNP